MAVETRGFGGLRDEIRTRHGEKIVELRRSIHREPELGFDTEKTARKVMAALDGLPLEIETGVAKNGLVARLRGARSGPAVGLRADMDALPIREETGLPFASEVPGKMHACGHDGHTSMLVGAAHALCGLRERLRGEVRFLFQPAEEGEGGGRVMVEEGALDGLSAVFALHLWPDLPLGTVATKPGPIMAAADGFELRVRGRGGHGAMPHETVDPVVISAQIVSALQTLVSRETDPADSVVVTVGKIHAGTAFNVIPQEARLGGTVRTLADETRRRIPRRIEELARGVAAGLGGDAGLEYELSYPVTVNDPEAAARTLRVAGELFGEKRVIEAERPSMGAEDFAFMLQKVPGAYVWLGIRDEKHTSSVHTPTFDFDESVLFEGSALLAALALDRLS